LLNKALRFSGERTYSGTVNLALGDFIRHIEARRILELAHSSLWQGDLSAMRNDQQTSDCSH